MTSMALAGVGDQIELLYRADGHRLWRAIFALTKNAEIASDVVAEAFAQALRRGTAVRDPQAWVWRAAFRLAAGEMRRQQRTADIPMPERVHLDERVDDALLEALQQLPIGQRRAVILHYYADLPVREIADRTGKNQWSVRADLSRGRKRLRALLRENDV